MNPFQLYRFLLNAPVKELQSFFASYDLHFSKTETRELQQLLANIPLFELKFPLSQKITDELKAIIGDKKLKQLIQLLQQYAL